MAEINKQRTALEAVEERLAAVQKEIKKQEEEKTREAKEAIKRAQEKKEAEKKKAIEKKAREAAEKERKEKERVAEEKRKAAENLQISSLRIMMSFNSSALIATGFKSAKSQKQQNMSE